MENNIVITSQEEVRDEFELANLLREIANKVENGYTTGYYPHWSVKVEYFNNQEENV
jgi:hypothetical protein